MLKKNKELTTEAEYSTELIKLLLSIIKWLIIAISLIIVMFLGTVIFILTNDNIEIEVGKINQKSSITLLEQYHSINVKLYAVEIA